jgi:hypothetical protein
MVVYRFTGASTQAVSTRAYRAVALYFVYRSFYGMKISQAKAEKS